jgi:hypothetical protein
VGVIFPLSGREAPFLSLANMLRVELQSCGVLAVLSEPLSEPHYTTILIWILTLGGIAATQFPLRGWFVENLGTITVTASIARWLEVKTRLQTMLWLSSACDCGGERLWKEVESLKSPRIRHEESSVSQANA